jgi:multiple sugar transport system ATP-binding protein
MNFIEGNLMQDGGTYLDEGTFKVEIPSSIAEHLRPYVGKGISFGVRPEAVRTEPSGEAGRQTKFRAKVEVVEPMGNETIVYVTTGRTPIVARLITREEIQPESEMDLYIDMRRVHFFDPQNEKTVV